jgi:hypothetical protein
MSDAFFAEFVSSDDDEEWQPPSLEDVNPGTSGATESPTIAARTRTHQSLVDVDLDEEMKRLELLIPREWDEMDADYEWFVRSTFVADEARGAGELLADPLVDDEDDEYVADDDADDDDDDFENGSKHHPLPLIPEAEIEFLKEETTVEGLAMLRQMSPGRPVARYESGRVMRSPRKVAELQPTPPPPPPPPSSSSPLLPPTRVASDGFARPRTPRRTTVVRVGSPTVTALAQLHALLRQPIDRWVPMRVPRSPAEEMEAHLETRRRAEERAPFMVSWPLANVTRRVLSADERLQLATQSQMAHQLLCQALVLARHTASFDMSSDVAALLVQLEVARERSLGATTAHLGGKETMISAALLPRERVAALLQLAASPVAIAEVSSLLAHSEPQFPELVPRLYATNSRKILPSEDLLLLHGMRRFANRDNFNWSLMGKLTQQRLLRNRTEKEVINRLRNRLAVRSSGPDATMNDVRAAVLDRLSADEFVALTSFEQERAEPVLRSRTHDSAVRLAQSSLYHELRELLPRREPLALSRLFVDHLKSKAKTAFESRGRGRRAAVPQPAAEPPLPTTTTTATTETTMTGAGAAERRRIVPSDSKIDPQALLAMATRSTGGGGDDGDHDDDDDDDDFEVEDLCTPPDDEGFEFEDLSDAPIFDFGGTVATAAALSSPPKRSLADARAEVNKRARHESMSPVSMSRIASPPPPATVDLKWTLAEDRAILGEAQRSGLLTRALQALKMPSTARSLFRDGAAGTAPLHTPESWQSLAAKNTLLLGRATFDIAARFDELVFKMGSTTKK